MNEKNIENTEHQNPFFLPYETPHNTVPFDRIRTSDYEKAFMEGIQRDDEEIEKITNNPDEPTFERFFVHVIGRDQR